MSRYLRDYQIDLLVDGLFSKKLTYSTLNNTNPLHVQFTCTIETGPSKLNLKIFNISTESQKLLQSDNIKVRLQVGFRDSDNPSETNLKTIFLGSVDPSQKVTTTSINADHQTSLSATEGYMIREVSVNFSAEPGVFHTQVIKDIVRKVISKSGGMLQADFSDLDLLGIPEVYSKGTSVSGSADKVLEDRLRMHDLIYTISRGVLKVHRRGVNLRSKVHEISLGTGLLSVPKPSSMSQGQAISDPKSTKAYSFVTLLNPDLVPLERIELNHPNLDQDIELLVGSVVHSGGYESSQWYSTVNAHFEYTPDKTKSISEAKQINNQDNIKFFDLINQPKNI